MRRRMTIDEGSRNLPTMKGKGTTAIIVTGSQTETETETETGIEGIVMAEMLEGVMMRGNIPGTIATTEGIPTMGTGTVSPGNDRSLSD
jgi:hypothetical protein